ncbi:MAG: PIG-L family deacetylase [Ignavibacteriae bacterium]|nr:PIG-L family deacetylase [Ignavibacteriota bacterium]
MFRVKKSLILLLLILFPISINLSQSTYSSSHILQSLKKLKVLGSVLYIAAHPDDENTAVLSYMSKGKLVRTAYLSLTRGDGGQNLLGKEKGDLLGVIRTQELLSARRLDGAEQFFTRAIDFGYSKTADETLNLWNKELILGDVVKVIREFRPDIILTRFSKTQGGHGHHLSSAILAEEALFAAADPTRFPEQLDKLEPRQPKRVLWNTWSPSSKAAAIDIGEYNPILGKSFSEISAKSRSMHKSQGFGVSPGRGTQLNHFDLTAGDSLKNNLFEGIDLTWNRVANNSDVENSVNEIIKKFEPQHPQKIVEDLVGLYNKLDQLEDGYWVNLKKKEIKEIIKMCSGLWLESIVWEPGISPGESIDVRTMIVNRSSVPIKVEKISTTYSASDTVINLTLQENTPLNFKQISFIPKDAEYSQPYWLREEHNGKVFTVNDPALIGLAENGEEIKTKFFLNIFNTSFTYEVPAKHRWTDAVKGEQFRPFVIRPELSLSVEQPTYVFAKGRSHDVNVSVKTNTKNAIGRIYLSLPNGWHSEPAEYNFNLEEKDDQANFAFKISTNNNTENGTAKLIAEMNGKTFTDQIIEIDYSHIPLQTVLQPAKTKLVKLDIEFEPKRIGYIMGSGDDIPLSLTQLGYELDLLTDDELDSKDLSIYDVIICGIRAFNTREQLGRQQKRLIEFVEQGGTWIVQHNTRFGSQVDQIGPFPFSTQGRDRIADETAPLQILMPEHQVFNSPNKITEKDFEGWVQERGLYFASSWEGKLYPLLAGNDKGEPSKLGGLLYANYGQGVFIFTAYSWFRQLPAGVPGAYRLFVNLISAKGKHD